MEWSDGELSMNYKTDIDYELLSKDLSDAEIVKYIKSNFYEDGKSSKDLSVIYKFLKLVHRLNNINPSNEQLVYILNNKKRVLCEACAGAGKTTMSYYRMIMFNAFYNIPSDKMLSLCYNKHASDKVEKEYAKIARSINNAIGSSGYIGTKIHAYTIHAWCSIWIKEYLQKFGLQQLNILEENEQISRLSSEIDRFNKKRDNPVNYTEATVVSLLQLYNFVCETLTMEQPEKWYSKFEDLHQFKATDLQQIMKSYDKIKKLIKRVDYSDLLKYMYVLVCDSEIVKRIRLNYKFIVVDEWQDVTPAMSRIIEKLVNGSEELGIPPYSDCYLTVIGDGDQSIYGFRGTDSDNCIKFRDNYNVPGLENEVCVTSMSINRRCKSVILSKAREIITSLTRRIQKPLNCIHDGGNIETYCYISESDEISKVVSILNRYKDELYDTCICYRNTSSSSYISTILLSKHIPFRVVRGIKPFADLYTTTINDLLNMLSNPNVPGYARKVLYKVLPKGKGFTKEYINKEISKHIEARSKSSRDNYVEEKYFWDYDFTPGKNQKGFAEAINILKMASDQCISGKAMFVYMPVVINLVSMYYFNNIYNMFYKDKISEEYISYVKRYYSCNLSYVEFKAKHKKDIEFLRENEKTGVYLTTMHGLKGLEFKNVIVMDLHDGIFPGTDLKGAINEEDLERAENEARRLFYVTVTRAKDNLHLMFSDTQPSRYIRYFKPEEHLEALYRQKSENSDSKFMSSREYSNYISDNVSKTSLIGTDYDTGDFILTEDLDDTQSVVIERNLDVKITSDKPENFANVKMYDKLPSEDNFTSEFNFVEANVDRSGTTDKAESIIDFNTADSDITDFDFDISDDSGEFELDFDVEDDNSGEPELDFDVEEDNLGESELDFDVEDDNSGESNSNESVDLVKKTPYDDIRATKPRLASILDILSDN